MQHLHISHRSPLTVHELFTALGEHENLRLLFRAPVKRVRSGTDHRNGVGSCRHIGPPGPLGFQETVTEFVPDQLIRYTITTRSPLTDHLGTMRFSPRDDSGSQLEYQIRFGSRIPGLAFLVRRLLAWSIPAGIDKLESRVASRALPT
jgi:hypothetical protein